MKNKEEVLKVIIEQGVLPLFYYNDVAVCIEAIRTLYNAGIRVMEFTNRAEGALDVYKVVRETVATEMPDLLFGAGTIKTIKDAIAFSHANADFFVSPNLDEGVAGFSNDRQMLWIPGCMTPSEINNAQQHQARLIKIFPANVLGPGFVTAVGDVFPGQLFMPTGGVEISAENITGWFNAGVAAVGMGSKLVSKEILQKRSWDELFDRTRTILQLTKQARENKL